MKYLRRLKNERNWLQERKRELTPEQHNRLAALNNAIGLVTLARQVESQTDHWNGRSETTWTTYHAALEKWLQEHPSPPNSEP